MDQLDLSIYTNSVTTSHSWYWAYIIAGIILFTIIAGVYLRQYYWLRADKVAVRKLHLLLAASQKEETLQERHLEAIFTLFKQWLAYQVPMRDIRSMTDHELIEFIDQLPQPQFQGIVSILSYLSDVRFSNRSIDKNEFSAKLKRLLELIKTTSATK